MLVLSRFIVVGHSMQPTISPGTHVFVSSLPYLFQQPKLGDLVVVKIPLKNNCLLKRITKIKGSNYFLSGDNSKDSTDSRKFGPVNRSAILGKVVAVI